MRPVPEFTPLPETAASHPVAPRIVLGLDETFALRDADFGRRGDGDRCLVRCLAGCCWLTLRHDPRDIILGPGDAFALRRADAPVVLTGLSGTATVLVVERGDRGR